MRPKGVCTATVLLLLHAGCGEDEILTRAAEERAAKSAAAEAAAGAAPGGAGPGGTPGAPGEAPVHQPGIPEEPAPVRPSDPPPVSLGAGTPVEPTPVPGGTGQPGDPAAVTPGDPVPGRADDPPPGKPAEPAPAIPGSPPGIPGVAPKPGGGNGAAAPTGPVTTVQGLVAFAEWHAGAVRVTAFDGEHAMAQGRQVRVVAEATIDRPGPFTLQVPQDAGPIYIEAAVDEDGNGHPDPLDPQGRAEPYPLRVGKTPITGVSVKLTRRAPPPEGKGKDGF